MSELMRGDVTTGFACDRKGCEREVSGRVGEINVRLVWHKFRGKKRIDVEHLCDACFEGLISARLCDTEDCIGVATFTTDHGGGVSYLCDDCKCNAEQLDENDGVEFFAIPKTVTA